MSALASIEELMNLERVSADRPLTEVEQDRRQELVHELFGEREHERRRNLRVEVEHEATLASKGKKRRASVTSMSAGGLFLSTKDATPDWVGERMEVAFRLPQLTETTLNAQVEVCWVSKPGDGENPGVGVRFVSLPPPEREQLLDGLRSHLVEMLERSHQQYGFFFQHSADVAILLNPAGEIVEVSVAGSDLLGVPRVKLVGHPLVEIVAPEWRADVGGALKRLASENRVQLLVELLGGEKQLLPVELVVTAVRARRFRIGAIVVAHDLGRRRALEEQQRRLERRLFQVDKLATIGQITAGIAHDINNPLAYILSNLGFLEHRMAVISDLVRFAKSHPEQCSVPPEELVGLKEELSQTLNDCLIGAERIRDIVADLHGYSRLDSRSEADVDVNAAMDAAIRVSKNLIKHTANLERDYEAGPLLTFCNFGRLSQVFLNLLTNAAQSFERSDVAKNVIRVSTRRHGDRIEVIVEDNGRGIPDDALGLIFEPFFTQRRNEGGTGLGLAIAKENAQALGGDLSVRSELGRGATFTVTLPVRESAQAPPDSGPELALEPRRRLLILDDEPAVLRALVRVLSRQLDVVTAESPKEALELAKRGTFDFVLCDVMMTEMDGLDFRERLASVRPELFDRVVFMTGGAFTLREQERLSEVTVPVLQKPLRVKELLQALHQVDDDDVEPPKK